MADSYTSHVQRSCPFANTKFEIRNPKSEMIGVHLRVKNLLTERYNQHILPRPRKLWLSSEPGELTE